MNIRTASILLCFAILCGGLSAGYGFSQGELAFAVLGMIMAILGGFLLLMVSRQNPKKMSKRTAWILLPYAIMCGALSAGYGFSQGALPFAVTGTVTAILGLFLLLMVTRQNPKK